MRDFQLSLFELVLAVELVDVVLSSFLRMTKNLVLFPFSSLISLANTFRPNSSAAMKLDNAADSPLLSLLAISAALLVELTSCRSAVLR